MAIPFVPPSFGSKSFNCPYCGAFSAQSWLALRTRIFNDRAFVPEAARWHMSSCFNCNKVATWRDVSMLVPDGNGAPLPHSDLSPTIASDFEEARSVLQRSPRSATALLRLALQKLCKELGEEGKNINDDIASLVQKGLPIQVQQALDIIRVIGNEQVHPGQLDVRDNPDIAAELFQLINFIVEDRITRPKAIQALYERLPAKKLEGIEQRDKPKA